MRALQHSPRRGAPGARGDTLGAGEALELELEERAVGVWELEPFEDNGDDEVHDDVLEDEAAGEREDERDPARGGAAVPRHVDHAVADGELHHGEDRGGVGREEVAAVQQVEVDVGEEVEPDSAEDEVAEQNDRDRDGDLRGARQTHLEGVERPAQIRDVQDEAVEAEDAELRNLHKLRIARAEEDE
jgi:hypothetical protein